MLDLVQLVVQSHNTAKEKGWWDQPRDFATQIALMHSELSEALEEFRKGEEETKVRIEDGKPEGVPIEFADVLIRIADTCGYYGIDLQAAVKQKLEYNRNRPFRHGGKKC